MILTLIIIGLSLLGLWLYFEHFYDESGTNAMSKSDIYSFQWMPKLFTQPHLLSPNLKSSAAHDALNRAVSSDEHSPSADYSDDAQPLAKRSKKSIAATGAAIAAGIAGLAVKTKSVAGRNKSNDSTSTTNPEAPTQKSSIGASATSEAGDITYGDAAKAKEETGKSKTWGSATNTNQATPAQPSASGAGGTSGISGENNGDASNKNSAHAQQSTDLQNELIEKNAALSSLQRSADESHLRATKLQAENAMLKSILEKTPTNAAASPAASASTVEAKELDNKIHLLTDKADKSGESKRSVQAHSYQAGGKDNAELELSKLRSETVRARDLEKEVNILRSQSRKIEELETELSTLRTRAQRASELEKELTTLKPRAQQAAALERQLSIATASAAAAQQLKKQLSEQNQEITKLKRQADRVTQVEASLEDRERVRREQERNIQQYKTRVSMLEDSVRKAETSNNTEATDSLEYRRLQSELIGVNQQRDKYVEQIRTLESQLKDQPPQSKIAPSRTPDRKASSNESKPRRQLLFTALAEKDDLKKIKGIGPVMERTLNELGVTSFKQLGEFNKDDVQRVSDVLDVFPGRIERDKWVPQARDRYQEKYGLKLT